MSLLAGYVLFLTHGPADLSVVTTVWNRIEQAPFMLFRHFFTVAFYSIWILFTHSRQVGTVDGKPTFSRPRPDEYPLLAYKSVQVVCSFFAALPSPMESENVATAVLDGVCCVPPPPLDGTLTVKVEVELGCLICSRPRRGLVCA